MRTQAPGQVEGLHIEFLKSIVGFPKYGISHYIVCAELGRYPLCTFWWEEVLSYRSRMIGLPRVRLLSRAINALRRTTGLLMLTADLTRVQRAMRIPPVVALMHCTPYRPTLLS